MTASTPHLVQAIAVVPNTHFTTIAAVAIASAMSAHRRHGDDAAWESWLDQAFTKTVRRARKPSEITKLEADPLVVQMVSINSARAFAYAPTSYEEFPAHLRRMQVSGLDIDRALDESPAGFNFGAPAYGKLNPLVIINDQLEISTGKAAAQVAHALVAWIRQLPAAEAEVWIRRPSLQLRIADLDELPTDPEQSITIHDNGLTEVDPGTATVRIALS